MMPIPSKKPTMFQIYVFVAGLGIGMDQDLPIIFKAIMCSLSAGSLLLGLNHVFFVFLPLTSHSGLEGWKAHHQLGNIGFLGFDTSKTCPL